MTAAAHAYHYTQASALVNGSHLTLATSNPGDRNVQLHPHFFVGRLLKPRLYAELLSTVQLVVGARFFTPANSVARTIMLADPVVTAGGQLLRFEGFSSCCSCYVRVDLLPEAYDGEIVGKGTTNVDFNAPMRAALAGVRDVDGLALSIGHDALTLRSGAREVVERQVALPMRWLRGMVEVQSYLAGMRRCFEVKGLDALRFFRTLPKASTSRTPLWVVSTPAGLHTTTRPQPQGVRVTDTTRLRVLEALLPKAQSMAVYADESQQSSAWVLHFPGARLCLTLSAETWRGFSGEGQALRALMRMDDSNALAQMRAQLNWQSSLDVANLSRELKYSTSDISDSLRVLGASGLVGFDVAEGNYFHRVLPFDLSAVEDMHPRLRDARDLLASGAVQIVKSQPVEATVKSSDGLHAVREVDGQLRCTCPWFAKHQGERGPCKHVLAVEASIVPNSRIDSV